jgi:poly-gamma-glutamate synthesis protein (capsule biosynthesis protein)
MVVAGGDVQLGRRTTATQLAAMGTLLGGGNLRLINLEGPLSDEGREDEAARQFSAPTAWARELRGRVDAASLANNHALDQGEAGREQTRQALLAQAISAVDERAPERRRGVTLLARHFPHDKYSNELIEAVRRAPRPVLVSLHWGQAGDLLPSAEQRRFAAALVDAGASAVIGHGPHTMQGVERRGHAVIAYSLGNLAYSCDCTDVRDAYLLRFRLHRDGRVDQIESLPIQAGLSGESPARSDDPDLRTLLEELSDDLERPHESLTPARGDEPVIKRRRPPAR